MKHAFLISAHKNFEQIQLLISTLTFGDVFIHVDKKQDALFNKIKQRYMNDQNIYVLENRIDVNWSGFSQVKATLALFDEVKKTKNEYDYIHFISGQDLLLMNENKFNQTLIEKGQNCEFIDFEPIGKYAWRLNIFNFFRENKNNRKLIYRISDIFLRMIQIAFVHRKNFEGLDLYKGSQWFSITFNCFEYILEKVKEEGYMEKYDYTACADEHFFQNLILNSKFKESTINNNLRYIDFDGMATSPRTLELLDYEKLINGDYIFARKFDMDVDSQIVKNIVNDINN